MGSLRVSYANSQDNLRAALPRMGDLLAPGREARPQRSVRTARPRSAGQRVVVQGREDDVGHRGRLERVGVDADVRERLVGVIALGGTGLEPGEIRGVAPPPVTRADALAQGLRPARR